MKKPAILLLSLAFTLLIFCPGSFSASSYLTGTVTSGQSRPVRSVWVMVFDGNRLKGRSLTGDDGRYYIGGLEAGTYTVVVRRQASGSNLFSESATLPRDRVRNLRLP